MRKGDSSLRRSIAAALAAGVLLAAVSPFPVSAAGLSDLNGHWARTAVEAGVARGYIAGYPDGTFRPESTITRAEFMKMLTSALRLPTAPNQPVFSETWHWSFQQGHIPKAVAAGYLNPEDYGASFGPDIRITRREIVMATMRALGKEATVTGGAAPALTAPDASQYPEWLRPWAAVALTEGIITGYEDRTVGLDRNATRAEALVMVQRVLNKLTMELSPDAGPGANGVRHPGEGEPTWSWTPVAAGKMTVTNGTHSFTTSEPVSDFALLPAPGQAAYVRFTAGDGKVVIGRVAQGRLSELDRLDQRAAGMLAVDDEGRLYYTDGKAGLKVASAFSTPAEVAGVRDRLTHSDIDWNGNLWATSGIWLYRVTPEAEVTTWPSRLMPYDQAQALETAEDGSVWLLARGKDEKLLALQLRDGALVRRLTLLGSRFPDEATVLGRSGPFLWVAAGTCGLYKFDLNSGSFARLVAPQSVATYSVVPSGDGGVLLRDQGQKYWRVLP